MRKVSVQLLCGASLALAAITTSTTNGSDQSLSQRDLRNPKAVMEALNADINNSSKASAKQFFSLGVKYRQRAMKEGNWGPVAKAFGESAVLYPRSLTLKEYAESSLRARSRAAARKGLEGQLEVLNETIDLYKSAIAADDVLRELSQSQRAWLDQNRICVEKFLRDRQLSSSCQPLQWLRIEK
jgi:hypothetical protein